MPQNLTPGDGQDVFARFKRAREGRDVDAMLELYAPDADYRTDPFLQSLTGTTAIRSHWNAVAAEQAHVEFDVERVWVSGRTVLGSWHAAHTLRSSASRVRTRAFSSIELDDAGFIVRMRDWPSRREVGADSTFDAEAFESGVPQDG